MKQLVKLNTRPSSDGKCFTYVLRFKDNSGKRRWVALGHSNRRKAEKAQTEKEQELRAAYFEPDSMRLSAFAQDSFSRTGDQIRESTRRDYESAMNDLISTIGDIDYQCVQQMHGELFRQARLDHGDSPATVAKKLRGLKRLFQLAIERKQLDENPFRYVKTPKSAGQRIRIYSEAEIDRLLGFASQLQNESVLEWDLIITLALTTGMRRSELLNLVWRDIDFNDMVIEVNPKADTCETWAWKIKDTDRRFVPLVEDVSRLLIDLQDRRPEGYPYVFVPPNRYNHIQKVLRPTGKWTLLNAKDTVVNNFWRQFERIRLKANVEKGTFHDIRKTAITNWLHNGLSEFDVMKLAGHSDFATTHRFYLAVADDLVARARQAVGHRVSQSMLEKCCKRTLRAEVRESKSGANWCNT